MIKRPRPWQSRVRGIWPFSLRFPVGNVGCVLGRAKRPLPKKGDDQTAAALAVTRPWNLAILSSISGRKCPMSPWTGQAAAAEKRGRSNGRGLGGHASVKFGHSLFDLRSEMSDESLDGPSGGVAQGANRVSFDLLRQFPQRVYLVGMCVSFDESVHHFHQPRRTLSARRALTARFVNVEF